MLFEWVLCVVDRLEYLLFFRDGSDSVDQGCASDRAAAIIGKHARFIDGDQPGGVLILQTICALCYLPLRQLVDDMVGAHGKRFVGKEAVARENGFDEEMNGGTAM